MVKFWGKVWNFIKLSRVQFLLGGFLLYALGAAAATRLVNVNWTKYLLGQIVMTSIQLMAQYLNEYYDEEVDGLAKNNRTWFSGGSGVLAEGRIAPGTILTAARICFGIAILTGAVASYISIWMFPIIVVSFLGSWFYSSPPISLMSSGWGEFTTSVIVALMVPLAGNFMQGSFLSPELWLVCIPLCLIHAAMLVSFEVPDYTVDQSVGKKTIAVRLGLKGAAWVVDGLVATAFGIMVCLSIFLKFPAIWMTLALPLAIFQMVMIHRVIKSPTRTKFAVLTAGGVGLFVIMSIIALVGFILVM
ncbi:MAG: prenyltransferase [Anaerolineaceae bacterium]